MLTYLEVYKEDAVGTYRVNSFCLARSEKLHAGSII